MQKKFFAMHEFEFFLPVLILKSNFIFDSANILQKGQCPINLKNPSKFDNLITNTLKYPWKYPNLKIVLPFGLFLTGYGVFCKNLTFTNQIW